MSLGQERPDGREKGLVTAGNTLAGMNVFLQGRTSYSAHDVLDYLLDESQSNDSLLPAELAGAITA